MLDDIVLFIQIVRRGGLAGAARHLNIPPATVTRRLQNLEKELGCQLLHRSARQFALTQEGEAYYESYRNLVEEFELTRQRLDKERSQLSGRLRVLAPTNFSHSVLRPMWLTFAREYSEIQLEVILSNQLEDMTRANADIAIRIGEQPDSLLYQQKIGQMATAVVASGEYLRTSPSLTSPDDLQQHRILGSNIRLKWQLTHDGSGAIENIFPRFSLQSNDLALVKYWALDHQGIALLPTSEILIELQSGALSRVLPEWRGHIRDIYAVWPSGRLLSERARLFRDYSKQFLEKAGLPSK